MRIDTFHSRGHGVTVAGAITGVVVSSRYARNPGTGEPHATATTPDNEAPASRPQDSRHSGIVYVVS